MGRLVFAAGMIVGLGLIGAGIWKMKKPVNPLDEPRHAITAEMEQAAKKTPVKPLSVTSLPDVHGKPFSLEQLWKGRKAVLVFVLPDCPCSIQAQPVFNRLAAIYGARVGFALVVKSSLLDASNYAVNMEVKCPALVDESASLAKQVGARASVYFCVVGANGAVEKLYPGYDRSKISELIAEITPAGMARPVLELTDVPTTPTSGCALFPSLPN